MLSSLFIYIFLSKFNLAALHVLIVKVECRTVVDMWKKLLNCLEGKQVLYLNMELILVQIMIKISFREN